MAQEYNNLKNISQVENINDPVYDDDSKVSKLYQQVGNKQLQDYNKKHYGYEFDPSATRIYFSRGGEIFGRILLFLTQIIMIIAILTIVGILGRVVTEQIPFSPILSALGKPLNEFITLTFFIFSLIPLLLLLIVVLIIKQTKTLFIFGILFATLFSILNIGIGLGNLVIYLYGNNDNDINATFYIVGAICGGAAGILSFIGGITIASSAVRTKKSLESFYSKYLRLDYRLNDT